MFGSTRVSRAVRVGAVAVVAAALAAGIASGTVDGRDAGGEVFWSTLRMEGDEAEGYRTLADMARGADAVVVGRFVSFGLGRVAYGDTADDVVRYGTAAIEIDSVVAGAARAGDTVPVEFLMIQPEATLTATATTLSRNLPDGQVVAFLRAKRGRAEAGLWRMVNSDGIWAEVGRSVGTPLGEAGERGTYAAELVGVGSVAELAARVRSLR